MIPVLKLWELWGASKQHPVDFAKADTGALFANYEQFKYFLLFGMSMKLPLLSAPPSCPPGAFTVFYDLFTICQHGSSVFGGNENPNS